MARSRPSPECVRISISQASEADLSGPLPMSALGLTQKSECATGPLRPQERTWSAKPVRSEKCQDRPFLESLLLVHLEATEKRPGSGAMQTLLSCFLANWIFHPRPTWVDKTSLTELERQFVQKRLTEEQSNLESLATSLPDDLAGGKPVVRTAVWLRRCELASGLPA